MHRCQRSPAALLPRSPRPGLPTPAPLYTSTSKSLRGKPPAVTAPRETIRRRKRWHKLQSLHAPPPARLRLRSSRSPQGLRRRAAAAPGRQVVLRRRCRRRRGRSRPHPWSLCRTARATARPRRTRAPACGCGFGQQKSRSGPCGSAVRDRQHSRHGRPLRPVPALLGAAAAAMWGTCQHAQPRRRPGNHRRLCLCARYLSAKLRLRPVTTAIGPLAWRMRGRSCWLTPQSCRTSSSALAKKRMTRRPAERLPHTMMQWASRRPRCAMSARLLLRSLVWVVNRGSLPRRLLAPPHPPLAHVQWHWRRRAHRWPPAAPRLHRLPQTLQRLQSPLRSPAAATVPVRGWRSSHHISPRPMRRPLQWRPAIPPPLRTAHAWRQLQHLHAPTAKLHRRSESVLQWKAAPLRGSGGWTAEAVRLHSPEGRAAQRPQSAAQRAMRRSGRQWPTRCTPPLRPLQQRRLWVNAAAPAANAAPAAVTAPAYQPQRQLLRPRTAIPQQMVVPGRLRRFRKVRSWRGRPQGEPLMARPASGLCQRTRPAPRLQLVSAALMWQAALCLLRRQAVRRRENAASRWRQPLSLPFAWGPLQLPMWCLRSRRRREHAKRRLRAPPLGPRHWRMPRSL